MLRKTALLACLTLAVSALVWADGELAYQELPAGQIPTVTILNARVGYGLFAGGFHYLPVGQEVDDASGATYNPRGTNVFMHPAWRLGPGWTVVEYYVHLPKVSPCRFVAKLGLDAAVIGKSDGVTYRVYAGAYAHRKILFERNVDTGGPVPVDIDLSAYAGHDLILGLEVDPGPKHDTSWDWSYWYAPTLVLGNGPLVLPSLPASTKARLDAFYKQGDKPFVNDRASTKPSPGPLADGKTSISKTGDHTWVFSFRSPHWNVDYLADLSDGRLNGLSIRQGKDTAWHPCAGGGLALDLGAGDVHRQCLSAAAEGDGVTAHYRYTVGAKSVDWSLHLALDGPYLRLQFSSDDQGIAGVNLGGPAGFRQGMPIFTPYMYFSDVLLINDGFACYVPDLWTSNASWAAARQVRYSPKTNHLRNPLRERMWVGYVPLAEMALQNIPNPPSPYLAEMSTRPVVDDWGGKFADITARLRQLAAYGVDHTFIIIHNWQHAGYDVKLPDTLPANPDLGGDDALRALCNTANTLGNRICVHENYVDMYPDAASWNPKQVALDSSGKRVKAWYQPATHIQSFLIKPLDAVEVARHFSPEIQRRFGTTGAYLDVTSAIAPWDKEDYDATQPGAAKFVTTMKAYAKLFAFERATHHGPLTGEGNCHAYWAGLIDGCEAQVQGGENTIANVAFDLCKVHPQNINHGMGYWSRWTTGTPVPGLPGMTIPIAVDKYRAQELSFGHAGFIGSGDIGSDYNAVREYYLTRWLMAKYGTAPLLSVNYNVGGQEVSLSEALMRRAPLERLHVRYRGLDLWVNWGARPWTVKGYRLPQWGYLALGPGITEGCTLRQGIVSDYLQTGDVLFADGRARMQEMAESSQLINDIPKVASFKQVGPRKFEIVYQWQCRGTTKRDATIFVHYVSPLVGAGENIAFAGDYKPATPLPEWQPGKTYTSQAFTVEVPEKYAQPGSIAVDVGIYDLSGRAVLGCAMTNHRKVHLGDLRVTGEGDAAKLTFVPDEPQPIDLTAASALMREHTNPQAKPIDFGPVVTSGCVIVRREGGRLSLIAVPRNEKLRVGLRTSKLPAAWKGVKLPAGAPAPDRSGITWLTIGG